MQQKNKILDTYFTLISQEGFVHRNRFRFYLNYIFKGISFEEKAMLDIGSGIGLYSLYAACRGAREVICLEPEAAGSDIGITEKFQKTLSSLQLSDRVKLEPTTIQNFNPNCRKFDIILLHNSINHLDEESCIKLQYDNNAVKIYRTIFQKLYDLSNAGAKIIICEHSRYNFFALFNIKNPFATTVEWHKHQSPEHWIKLLSSVGFSAPKIRWTSFKRLGLIGRLLFGNKVVSYFVHSHFCLTMQKK